MKVKNLRELFEAWLDFCLKFKHFQLVDKFLTHFSIPGEALAELPQYLSAEQRLINVALLSMFSATSLILVLNVYDSTFLKLPIMYVLTLAVIMIVASESMKQGVVNITFSLPHILFLLYIVAGCFSMFMTPNMRLSLEYLAQLVCYFVVLHVGSSILRVKQTLYVMTIVTASACVVALAYVVVPESSGLFEILKQLSTSSTFGNQTYFAGFLMLMLPLMISQAVIHKDHIVKQLMYAILAVIVITVLARTESRSAWIAAFVSGLFFIGLNFRSSRMRWIALGGMVLMIAATGILFHEVMARRLGHLLDLTPQSSISRRLFFYEGAWKAFLASPIIGNGLGNFIVFLPNFRSPEYWLMKSEDIVPHAHNEYLEILSETGIIGMLFFGSIVVLVFTRAVRTYRKMEGSNRTMLVGCIASVAGGLIDNLSSLNLRTVPVALSFWIIIGLILQQVDVKTRTNTLHLPSVLQKLRFAPLFVWILFVIWESPQMYDRYISEKDYLAGLILRYHNQRDDASAKFTNAIMHNRHLAEARLYLGANLIEQARYAEAKNEAKNILEEFPFYPKARIVSALASFELGDTTTAMNAITEEMRIENSPQVYFFAADMSRRSNHPGQEYEYVTALIRKNIQSGMNNYVVQAVERLDTLCLRLQGRTECFSLLDSLQNQFGHDLGLVIAIGQAYVDLGTLTKAQGCADHVREFGLTDTTIIRSLNELEMKISATRR